MNRISFNPYFTGSNSGRYFSDGGIGIDLCFNPYFTGSNSGRYQLLIYILLLL